MGASAAWTPDSKTLYIYDNSQLNTPASCATPLITGHTDALYVYSLNSGWTTYALPPSPPLPTAALPTCTTEPNVTPMPPIQTPAITVPGVGAYTPGNPTVAHTWCPETVTPTPAYPAGIEYYPLGDTVNTLTDVLAATTDGQHILGAALSGGAVTISDIGITLPTSKTPADVFTPSACPISPTGALLPLNLNGTLNGTLPVNVNATTVNQVVPAPNSALAFMTYNGDTTGAALPYYLTAIGGANGTVGYVTLTGGNTITAPLVGAFSPDGTLFFVGTAGDNLVHYISVPPVASTTTPPTDTQQIAPGLPSCIPVSAGGTDAGCLYTGTDTVVPVTAIVVKPRSTT
jgi:hypothetical protein